jgi:hypothetical protein
MDMEITAQARAARVTYLLALRGEITTDEVRRHTGLTTSEGVGFLMKNVESVVPVEKARRALWRLKDDVTEQAGTG